LYKSGRNLFLHEWIILQLTGPRWTFDEDNLTKATNLISLKRSLKLVVRKPDGVNISSGDYFAGAKYLGIQDGKHLIWIDPAHSPQEASDDLWHELIHAKQVERDFQGSVSEALEAYRDESYENGYENNKYEIEANEASEKYRWITLTKRWDLIRYFDSNIRISKRNSDTS